MLESVSLGILGHSIPTGTHVCAFYSGPDGRDELVLPYLAEGIRTAAARAPASRRTRC